MLLSVPPRFCGECLQPCLQVPSPLCPLCRMPFDPKKVEKASSVEKQLSSYKAPCRGCSKKVKLAGEGCLSPSCVDTASFGCRGREIACCLHLGLQSLPFHGSPNCTCKVWCPLGVTAAAVRQASGAVRR